MFHGRLRTVASALVLLFVAAVAVRSEGLAFADINQARLTAVVPSGTTPDVLNGAVKTILEVGGKVIVGGTFTRVSNNATPGTVLTRNYLFAFNKSTNVVDTGFKPVLNGQVEKLLPGPTSGTFYVAGQFTTINGVTRNRVALMNASNGSLNATFKPPAITGIVNSIAIVGSHMMIGGTFAKIGGINHSGIGSLNPTTGALDPWMNIQLTGHHNYDQLGGALGSVGAMAMAVAPNASKAIVVGNFKQADGADYDQAVLVNLSGASPTIANWQTNVFDPPCAYQAFDAWIRNTTWAPDGSYFVIVATGAPFPGTACDTVTRWEADQTGTDLKPTWMTYSGGDTFLSAAITGVAIYVGGHFRWLNNSFGTDSARFGAVGRASIAALDPRTGLPLSWNPGRDDRGPGGVYVMYPVPDGLWLGYDTDWLGQHQWKDRRIGFFPLGGGLIPPTDGLPSLPGKIYMAGQKGPINTGILYRVNAGGPAIPAADNGPDWEADTDFSSPYRNSGSHNASFGTVANVTGAVPTSSPRAVFDDERADSNDTEMQWSFPVTSGKQVKVRLYFANQTWHTSQVGQRVFNVTLEGSPILTNYDIVADVGDQTGTMKEYTVTSDGTININFGHVVENPLINAIEIIDPSIVPPPVGTSIFQRSYDGTSSVGPTVTVSNPDSTLWDNARGAFYVNGKLFYGMSDGSLIARTFNGTTFGTPSLVDPYHDNDGINPDWDTVQTGSGQTYAGIASNFYSQITSVTGLAYRIGKIYYTLAGQDQLFWRWFLPENGVIGADTFIVTGSSGFNDTTAMTMSGNTLYTVNGTTGNLATRDFTGPAPSAPTTVSGPGIDGNDWHTRALFIAP